MGSKAHHYLTGAQQAALVILRTLIGWHFLYESYYKLMLPAWSADGKPLPPWTSAGYLKAASGPLARVFQWMIDGGRIGRIGWIDNTVKVSLLLIGLSLILGLLTRVGLWGALFFLALFYLLAIPTAGAPQPGNEGTYLIVNKTLIEGAAVGVLLTFNTGAIAGLDMFLTQWKGTTQRFKGSKVQSNSKDHVL
ncbi:MAG TPA: DoxX subfamily [Blastocatellia bacterium]|nr:DoxX subfamily [Blastocatellia bacterium]